MNCGDVKVLRVKANAVRSILGGGRADDLISFE